MKDIFPPIEGFHFPFSEPRLGAGTIFTTILDVSGLLFSRPPFRWRDVEIHYRYAAAREGMDGRLDGPAWPFIVSAGGKREGDTFVSYYAPQVVISSSTESRSLDVADVLRTAIHLTTALYVENFQYWSLADDETTRTFNDPRSSGSGHLPNIATTGIVEAGETAIRLFSQMPTRIAALRYLASIEAAHLTYHMGRPEADPIYRRDYRETDRVRLANAATLAYTAIEDLGLEIRASSKNPSRINGSWNAAVLDELRTRLREAGIDPKTRLIWHRRTPPTRIERLTPQPTDHEKPSWSAGVVRDVLVTVVEGVALCSTIRSKASAHGRASLGRSLNVYDVSNVQSTVRALLLDIVNEGKRTTDRVLRPHRARIARDRAKILAKIKKS